MVCLFKATKKVSLIEADIFIVLICRYEGAGEKNCTSVLCIHNLNAYIAQLSYVLYPLLSAASLLLMILLIYRLVITTLTCFGGANYIKYIYLFIFIFSPPGARCNIRL